MRQPLLLEGLAYDRAGGPGVDGFCLRVDRLALRAGEVLGIVGPSGCGKSTLLDILALLRRPTHAERFAIAGEDALAAWRAGTAACTKLRRSSLGVVLQTGGLLPSLSVWDNLVLPQHASSRIDRAWARALLAALDLTGLEKRLPSQLSVGQRQRLSVGRGVSHRPALVLADEPTAALGVEHAPATLGLLVRVAEAAGTALVVVSHDVELLRGLGVPCRRIVQAAGAAVLEEAAAMEAA